MAARHFFFSPCLYFRSIFLYLITSYFHFSIHHSDNSLSPSYLVFGFTFPLRPLSRTRAERISFLHIPRRPSTSLEELLPCAVRQPALNFDFLQHPQASLQLPLRIVFPTSNCKIRQGKKRKTQGEKREKRRRPEPRNKFHYEGSRFVRPQLALSLPSRRISDI